LIYLDHAATTPLHPTVLDAMLPFLTGTFGNASEPHAAGRAARAGLEGARRTVAAALGVAPDEVRFGAGGSEADNLAVLGRAAALDGRPGRIVASAIEHPAVREPLRALETAGWEIAWVAPDGEGQVPPDGLAAAVRPGDALCALIWANNITGVVQPVEAAAALCAERGVPLHLDAVQTPGGAAIDVGALPGEVTVAIAAHKIGGPKGVGAIVGRGVSTLAPVLRGGGQERGLRPGTENVAGAVGLATALARRQGAASEWEARAALRDRLVADTGLPCVGAGAPRLPGHALLLAGVRGDALVAVLDDAGICVAAGSACASGDSAPSHVLVAMGLDADTARTALRVTLGPETTAGDVDALVAALRPARASLTLALRGLAS